MERRSDGAELDKCRQAGQRRAVYRLPRVQRPRRLGPETLRKVLAAAQEIGYDPTTGKQAEPTPARDTATVAIVLPDIANPVFGSFVKAAQDEVRRGNQTLVLLDTDFDPEREARRSPNCGPRPPLS